MWLPDEIKINVIIKIFIQKSYVSCIFLLCDMLDFDQIWRAEFQLYVAKDFPFFIAVVNCH